MPEVKGARIGESMKIIFLAPASSTHTEKWVNTLSAKGVEVHLAYIKGHEPVEGHISEDVKLHPLSKGGGKAYYLCGKELRALANEIKPDLINAHYASGYGTLARMAHEHPVALSFWGSDIYEFPYKNALNRSIIKKNVRAADYIISTSHCMADEIRKVMGCPGMEIGITPFGIDTKLFKPSNEEKETGLITVGTVKALETVYRIDLLIDAFARTVELAKGTAFEGLLRLKIYGDGSCKDALQAQIESLGMDDYITLEGRIPNTEVPKAIEDMELFCAFSEKESFGVAVVEAMAMEVATLTSAAEGFCEVAEEGVTGRIVRSDDKEDYARAIFEMLEDRDKLAEMGVAGRKRAIELYDWDKNVDTMIDIYGNVLCEKE